MAIAVQTPHDQLRELEGALGQRGTARFLGKSQRVIWSWLNEGRKLQARNVNLIAAGVGVIRGLKAVREFAPGELELALFQPLAETGVSPAQLVQEGAADDLLVELEAGSAATVREMGATMTWKRDLEKELERSVAARIAGTGEPLHEEFVFLQRLGEYDTARFAVAAGAALSRARTRGEWEAFIAPYWESTPARAPASPAAVTVAGDMLIDDDDLDELLVPGGALASARFPRRT
jgi:hypothetical protein